MAVLKRYADKPAVGRCAQSGFSLWSALYVLITLGLILLVGGRSVPVYLNNRAVSAALHDVANDPTLLHASRMDVQRALEKRFDASYIEGVSPSDLKFSRNNGATTLKMQYEIHRSFMFNIALVYHFDDVAQMGRGDD